jgi:hypothetical protein
MRNNKQELIKEPTIKGYQIMGKDINSAEINLSVFENDTDSFNNSLKSIQKYQIV